MTVPVVQPPGPKIGGMGGGQLGRMLAIAARYMGYRGIVLGPDRDCSAGQVADEQVVARYESGAAARDLARCSDIVTYEFENIDAEAVEAAAELTRVSPRPYVPAWRRTVRWRSGPLPRRGDPRAVLARIDAMGRR